MPSSGHHRRASASARDLPVHAGSEDQKRIEGERIAGYGRNPGGQGDAELDALYTAMGTRIHNEGAVENPSEYGDYNGVIVDSLAEVGLDAAYIEVADTEQWDDALKKFHQSAMDEVGDEVGTPVIKLGDTAFFGPVLTRIPRGEEAGEIFDASIKLARYPHFFEIKRSRTEGPEFN